MFLRAPHKLVIDATFTAGELTKTYHLEFPAKTPLDEVEEVLTMMGIIEPVVTGSPLAELEISPGVLRPR